ncbi:TPA: hypothetical protein ACPZFU_003112 [Yersinia enterocolitica]|uniref:hypothetical protein n=1 Tax=Yersinia enterocolitica TaxID=630 RepID=UPI0005DBC6AE|nr:hypothetical protein [Yersinia enterocolitica]EKN3327542.1 hypothetical protein [Yersinia enterocolitica]EKN3351647.1 hypothetical protein [Yersinia enterocolitica]EKN3359600.1 hypothetical protein [Yersinia enterocolitica]EKN3367001.1 hypothetical protein [Yersinia enterocolitica]EKN3382763.1 hypothetical protein [Yersinia enterocolitica]
MELKLKLKSKTFQTLAEYGQERNMSVVKLLAAMADKLSEELLEKENNNNNK